MKEYRILDASLNRLREALRVIEDVTRFSLDNAKWSEELKSLRHELACIAEKLGPEKLLSYRDIRGDVGKNIEAEGEYARENIKEVLIANFKRAQEASRVLEESTKGICAEVARSFEKLRYRLYEMEQKCVLFRAFPKPCLYALVTKSLCLNDPAETLRQCCDQGADVVQLREKEMEDGEMLKWIEEAMEIARPYATPLIVNDRVHLARLGGVAGVHLGQGDIPISRAREILSQEQWVGLSTHCLSQALSAKQEGADYIGVGPIYPTNTKVHRSSVGVEYLVEVRDKVGIDYVAIGSVNRDSIDTILEQKPSGVAICTGIIAAKNPAEETAFFKKKLDSIWES